MAEGLELFNTMIIKLVSISLFFIYSNVITAYRPCLPTIKLSHFKSRDPSLHEQTVQLFQSNIRRIHTDETVSIQSNRKYLLSKVKALCFPLFRSLLPIAFGLVLGLLSNFVPIAGVLAAVKGSPVVTTPKSTNFLKRILDGVNGDGAFQNWKIGDTRSEYAAIFNAVSGLIIFGGISVFAFLIQKYSDFRWNSAYTKEVVKVQEYKENMYFEAVQDILTKLEDTKIKSSTKAYLQKQLQDLDPDGVIAKFLTGNGPRPDISDRINKKPTKKSSKSASKASSIKERPKKPSASASATSKPPVPTTGSAKSTRSSTGGYDGVLGELYASLTGVLDNNLRDKLLTALQTRVSRMADKAKQESVLEKIRKKIGDVEYWREYIETL